MNPESIDAETAERLADGDRVGLDRLERVLAAAAAPGRPTELAGEAAALAAFRAASAAPEAKRPAPVGRRPRRVAIAAAAAAASVAVAGVAFAASTGALPVGLNPKPAQSGLALPATPASRTAGVTGPPRTAPPASPDPALVGLCRAYVARVATNPGHALDNPAFARLITAAGRPEDVPAFCARLLADAPPSAGPTTSPSTDDDEGAPNKPNPKASKEPKDKAAQGRAAQGKAAQEMAPRADHAEEESTQD